MTKSEVLIVKIYEGSRDDPEYTITLKFTSKSAPDYVGIEELHLGDAVLMQDEKEEKPK